jgi:hypothetical protein
MGPWVGMTTSKGGTLRAFLVALALVLLIWWLA